ncbi:MAG: histidine kinase [Bacteroidetes bacterium]|nr:histidine kinase [Bacteroidota bacterium]
MTVDLERKMAQLEVKLLRAQFNSHFLFNNLNAINYRILQNDSQTASAYLTLFSRLMRRILADSRRDFNRLSDEIETIRLYLQVESMRFNRTIQLITNIEPGLDPGQIWIPSLILHTYLENSVWQSMLPRAMDSILILSVQKQANMYHIVLEDNGFVASVPRSAYAREESGMSMAQERLRLLNQCYGVEMQITTGEKAGATSEAPGTRVDLSFKPFFL